jgi:hypothetical protein
MVGMTSDSGGSIAAVEIVTQSYAITGCCHGLTEQMRLIDLLNNSQVTHLQLDSVKVRELLGCREVIATDGPLVIDKDSVVFARSLESPQAEEKRRETHRVDIVKRAAYLMLVFAPPFRILGNVYLVKDADFSVALPRLFDHFLAMTETKAVREGDGALAWDSKFMVVNGRRIEMVCVSPPPA